MNHEKIKQVVNIAFINDNKLLVVKSVRSSKTNLWTLVGGGVEPGESVIEAALREIREEIGEGYEFNEEDLLPILGFKEMAASDSDIIVEINVFLTTKDIHVSLNPNDEILEYHWYSLGETEYNLSSSIIDHLIPYLIQKGLLK